ncbi:MAG: beta-L-arabinofuranosidase domain-containing protein [bacterium]
MCVRKKGSSFIGSCVLTGCVLTAATGDVMTPFPLSQTRLLDGDFKAAMQTNLKALEEIGVERALYCFRFQAGLPTREAKPLESWARPEPGGAFPGFYEGHYLSALSLAYAQTGDPALLERVTYMVAELGKCQAAQGGKYLFASPEGEFEPTKLDGVVWFRMHKLLEGLLAAHRVAGSRQALSIATQLAEWIKAKQDDYTAKSQWEAVKRVEFGGMQEALENLYIATGNPVHKELSRQWEERGSMLTALAQGKDAVGGHANTVLAKMVGVARTAEHEKDAFYIQASSNFWDFVAGSGRRCYATGGTSVHEGFPGARSLADTQSRFAQETCCSYNLLKITRSLFLITGDLKYMEYFERSLFNSILGSQDLATGWKTYYQPLNANTVKDFRSHLKGCYCCNGTGLESFAKFGETVYSHDAAALYVNLFIASTVDWPEKKLRLEQVTAFPAGQASTITVHVSVPTAAAIGIRRPGWCAKGFAVKVNGKAQAVGATPATYAMLTRTWKEGDRIDVSLPMAFTQEPMPNKATQTAFLYGPLVLVGVGARPYLSELVADAGNPRAWINNLDAWFKPVKGKPLTFTGTDDAARRVTFKPYYQVGMEQFFTGYWDLVAKAVRADEGNVALGKATTCSTPEPEGCNVESFMRSAKAVDGNCGGDDDWYVKWFPNGGAPQWLTVDLGAPHGITAVEWFPAVEDVKGRKAIAYKLETSGDNTAWIVYADNPGNKECLTSYRHEKKAQARYVRFSWYSQTGADGKPDRPKLAELKVFGAPL